MFFLGGDRTKDQAFPDSLVREFAPWPICGSFSERRTSVQQIKLTRKGRRRLLNDLRLLRRPEWMKRRNSTPQVKLNRVDGRPAPEMLPGDVVLYADAEFLRSLIKGFFFAVLACPKCGTLGLITGAQFFGFLPVTCRSSACSCRFRIDDQRRIVCSSVSRAVDSTI